jgi:hypothetical protein
MTSAIPLPQIDEVNEVFWAKARDGILAYQQCDDCDNITAPPETFCVNCLSPNLTWRASTGRGRLVSHSVVHRPSQPVFETPYYAAIVELDEGWYAFTNLIDVDDEPTTGTPVEVAFVVMSDEISLPYFRPVQYLA